MVDDDLAVGRDPDIELRAVDAQLLRLGERSYGVLGGAVLVVAPVGDHPGFGDSGGIIRIGELRDAQRVLVLAAHQHHPVPARGKSVRDAHRKRLRCGRPVERESPGTAGERFEADPVPGGKPLAVERVGVIGTHLAARKVEQPGNVDRGGLLVAFDGFPQSLHLFGRERGVVDACDGHVAFPGVLTHGRTGVDADAEPVARRGGGRHVVARGIHRTLQLAVYVDVGLGLLLVPYAHDVVIAPRLGVDAALRPYPVGFPGRADVGQEGQFRTLVGLADKESGAAARHRTEHLQLGRTIRLLIQFEERLERVPVGERILELLVGRVVGLVEPLVDGRARRVVEMGRIPRIEVVVVGHHRRTFERPHGRCRRGVVHGRTVVAEHHVEQVGRRKERLAAAVHGRGVRRFRPVGIEAADRLDLGPVGGVALQVGQLLRRCRGRDAGLVGILAFGG